MSGIILINKREFKVPDKVVKVNRPKQISRYMIPWYEIPGRRSRKKHPDPSSLVFVMVFNAVWEARARTAHGALWLCVC